MKSGTSSPSFSFPTKIRKNILLAFLFLNIYWYGVMINRSLNKELISKLFFDNSEAYERIKEKEKDEITKHDDTNFMHHDNNDTDNKWDEEDENHQDDEYNDKSSSASSTSNQDILRKKKNQTTFLHQYDSSNQIRTPPDTPGAFLHIGKTAGSTLSHQLRNGCHSFVKKPCTEIPLQHESAISKLTTYYHTPDFISSLNDSNQQYNYQFFVITMRDPLSRWISAYQFHHPKNHPPFKQHNFNLYSCFETLEEYAQLLSNFTNFNPKKQNVNVTNFKNQNCDVKAKSTIYHINIHSLAARHFFWDIRQVLSRIQENLRNKTILSVRTEFLWTDWTTANQWLGDKIVQVDESKRMDARNSTKMETGVNLNLSDQGRKNLCLALESEYNLYLKVLQLSVNLTPKDREDSLAIARENCPWLNLNLPNQNVPPEMFDSYHGVWEF
jgi:hypothetical protein